MIDTVIFDVGNVLVTFDWESYLASYGFPPEKYEAIADVTYRNPEWTELDRGVLTREEVASRMVALAPQYEEDIRRVVKYNYKTIGRADYAEGWVRELKARGIKTYYLSNYGKEIYEETKKELAITKLLDGGIFSYEVKLIKPDRWIYEELLRRYSIDRTKAVFFDDLPANIAAAREVGLTAFQFTDYETARKDLEPLLPHA